MILASYCRFIVLILSVSVSSLSFAFEDAFFSKKGKFSCYSPESCRVPSVNEVEWIKAEFKGHSGTRLNHLTRFEDKANNKIDNILWRSQESELKTNQENSFSEFYKNMGSFLDKKFGEMKIETAKVVLSEGSPFIMELEDLQGVLSGALTHRNREDITDAEKYYNWFNRPAFQQLLEEMGEVRQGFFVSKTLELSSNEKVDLLPLNLVTCPKKLKNLIAKRFFEKGLDIKKDFFKRVLGEKNEVLTVKCSPVKSKKPKKLRSKFNSSSREIVLPYRVGKRRSVSPVKKMFDKIK